MINGDKITQAILGNSEQDAVTNAIMVGDEPTDEVLNFATSSRNTSMAQDIYGEDFPPITTVDTLHEADEVEAKNLADENQEAAIEADIQKIADGSADARYVSWRARDNAVKYFETLDMGEALAVNNARQLAAEAEVDSAALTGLDPDYKRELAKIQEKAAFVKEFFTRMQEEVNQDGLLKSIARRIGHSFAYSLPGADPALASEAAGAASAGFLHPVENEHRIHEMWWGAVNDPNISVEALSSLASQYNDWLDSKGFSKAEKADVAAKIIDRMPRLAAFSAGADLLFLGGAASSIGKATAKGAVKGGVKAAIREGAKAAAKEVTEAIGPVKNFAREGGLAVKVGEKIGDSKLGRYLFYGQKERAVKEVIDSLPTPSLKRDLVQTETDTGVVLKRQEIYEAYVGNAIDVGETTTSHIATDKRILTEKGLRQYGKKIYEAVKYLEKETGSIKAIENMTWEEVAKKVATDYSRPEWVELIKAVPTDDLGLDVQGNIIARIRHPQEFKSAEDAQAFINTLDSSKVSPKIFPNSSGTYSVDLDLLTDYSFVDFSKDKKESWSNRYKSGAFTFSSAPKDIRELDMARLSGSSTLQSVFSEAQKAVDDLSRPKRELLDAIHAKEVKEKAFYRPEQLIKSGVPEDVVDAHARVRAVGDVEFFLRNEGLKRLWNRMGIKQLTSADGSTDFGYGTVKQFSSFDSFKAELMKHKNVSFYNDVEDKVYKVSEIIDKPALKEQFEKLNLTLVNKVIDKSTNVRKKGVAMLAPRDAIVEQNLPAFVLNYLPGGHKYFERGAGFMKQMDIRNGVMVGCKTIMIDSDKLGLMSRREALEELRLALGRKASDLDLNAIIAKHNLPFKNGKEAAEFITARGIDIENADNVLEVLNHGELPSLYKNNMKTGWYEELADADYMQMQANLGEYEDVFFDASSITRSKINRDIVNYAFNPVTTVDTATMLKYVISDLQDLGLMRDYAQIYAKKFYDTFREISNIQTGSMNPLDFLYKTDFEKMIKGETNPAKKKLMSQAITAQKNFEVLRGIPSDVDSTVADIFSIAVNKIGGFAADALQINEDIRHGVRVKWGELFNKSKTSVVSTATTHFFLGLGNYTQFLKNVVQPVTVTMTIEPVAGGKAFKHLFPFMSRLNGVDNSLMKRVKALQELEGVASDEAEILFANAMKVGLDLSHSKGGAAESVESMTKFGKASMYFFNKADTINKSHSLLTALISKGFDKKLIKNADEINFIRSYRDTLFMNMDRSGMSRLQHSQLARIATQFQSATFRAFETFCFDRNLTAAQKRRLWTVQLLLGGTTSIWGGANVFSDAVFGALESDTEELDPVLQEVKATLEEGILNEIVRLGGYNFSPNRLWQMGAGDLAGEVLEMSPMGLITGIPAVSAAGKFLDGLTTMTNWTYNKVLNRPAAEFSSMLKVLARRGDLSTVPNKLEAAYSLMTSGVRYNSRGELSSEDNRLLAVVAGALGLPDQTDAEVYRAKLRTQKAKNKVSDFVKKWTPLYLECSQNGDTDGVQMIFEDLSNNSFTIDQKSSIIQILNNEAAKKRLIPIYERALLDHMNDKYKFGTTLIRKPVGGN